MAAFIDAHSGREVLVRGPRMDSLRRMLSPAAEVRTDGADAVMAGCVGALLTAAFVVFRRRDA
ncbi:hypothetical protein GCM10022420_065290 [Streptomyces iranensis]|uniref:Uncharacterized protein n=1 Tax=Streptomyces iranensis TaxID=576784 RepID=A0A061A0I5_9ACTN|nr:hypothetical protein [Streptomyces iranensis]CDR14361.1 predicted protein [Streptomyces iranensis]